MKKTLFLTAGVLLSAIILTGCTREDVEEVITKAGSKIESEDATEANNRFAIDLYDELASEEGNLFFSPFSVSSVMTMLYEGSNSATETQLFNTLYLPEDNEKLRADYQNLYKLINIESEEYDLSIANALWLQEDYEIVQDYLKVINDYYAGEAQNLNFVEQPERSRRTINDWVEDETNNRIKDLIPSGAIDQNTQMVVTNAIYFLGEWLQEFDPTMTYKADFRKDDGTTVKVDMMNRSDDESIFDYYENNDLEVLRMPYSGNDVSMIVLLPKDGSITDLENKLGLLRLESWLDDLENQRVNVYFPKFEFESKYEMNETLADMGIVDLFGYKADLTDISEKNDLFVSSVVHQANITVDENGTEAAAATGAIVATKAAIDEEPVPLFKADHPFIFMLRHEQTGNILFMGRVNDPLGE